MRASAREVGIIAHGLLCIYYCGCLPGLTRCSSLDNSKMHFVGAANCLIVGSGVVELNTVAGMWGGGWE